ncbi:TetR/AcrR family transcriptional regulator [Hymenobacter sp.]|uniref:TetR/AcrR family transcriptional regulator n=1 Tax=Hymenobacter sp. TaxID=1898978 RepID=UPI00286C88B2|nr:TetR/AcrR family transcriptional regulator [Hymenobacter sp.]
MEIKDRILLHASALFMRNGIKSVSMDDIAAEMAMSKKTLYKWFATKDEMVHAVMGQHLETTQGECAQLQQQAGSAVDELFRMMGWMRQQFADVHPSIFYDMQKFHPATWQLWVAHKNQYILAQITDNLHRGIAEELYRADLDVDVLARLRLAQIELAFNADVFPARQFDVQRLQQAILEHFMLGIASLKGHKLINDLRHVTEAE